MHAQPLLRAVGEGGAPVGRACMRRVDGEAAAQHAERKALGVQPIAEGHLYEGRARCNR